jgi:hypothetical protein
MKSPLRVLIYASGLILACPALADEAKSYVLKLQRDPHAGEKSHESVKVTSEESVEATLGGRKLKSDAEEIRGELSGILEVIEVSPHGKVQKIQFTVEQFTCQKDVDAEEEPFEKGAVITGKLGGDGKEVYTVDGKQVGATAAKVLKAAFELSKDRENDVTDDVIFRTAQPRSPGTEWEMDKEALIKSLPDDVPFKLAVKEVTATVKFDSIKKVDGAECALLRPTATMKPSKITGLPPGFKSNVSSLTISGEMLVPLDEKLIIPSGKTIVEMKLDGTVDSPNGQAEMKIYNRTEKVNASKPVK